MPLWATLAIQISATVVAVLATLWGFWRFVVRPYLDAKVDELIEASREIEPAVTRGVKKGVADTIRELPESALDGTVKESTRQFLKFGSGLFENGLSSFLGTAADLERNRRSETGNTSKGSTDS
ncbi:hypothetical protein A8B84_12525 [Marinobacter sp. EhC06]|jgi:hypothetical protein|uniref:hypothetical protein n=1 Tax=Marinobacter TaxID=2742 RepID=UPI0007D9ACD7|nr:MULTISPECIES: hypothetical protein [Marinobacter]MCD1647165.1 hypothetical protein [Marinobacter adhaerens]OAN87265.1 hypothetical protein A8B80_10885 [Marinobacter sp. EhN04]OAN89564.1 hypothetical protein A8B84_12525 [Marinobacter sp. EhC06]